MAAPTYDDLYNAGKTEIILKRSSLGVRIGDLSDMLLSAAAAIGDRIVGYVAQAIVNTFLDGATGDDLTKLSADHWSIQREAATNATATVTFNRSGADATATTLPIGTVVATIKDSQGNEVDFITTAAASWAISTNGTRTVACQCTQAGVVGNLTGTNQLTRLISTPPGHGTYTITASTQPAGGAEIETDEALRDRVRKYPSTVRRGTFAAIEYGAIQTTGAGVAKATASSDATGAIAVYVSDASGNSTGGTFIVDPTLVSDGTMTAKVAVELLNWAAAGALVSVTGGSIQTVNITVSLVVRLGVDVSQLITDVQAAINARVSKLSIGATLYKSDIINAVKAVDPDFIVDVAVVSPSVDTAPSTPGSLIRAGVITVS